MPPNNTEVYLGTWCHAEERSIRLFFVWYFRESTRNPSKYPRNLTPDKWFEQFQLFHLNILPSLEKED